MFCLFSLSNRYEKRSISFEDTLDTFSDMSKNPLVDQEADGFSAEFLSAARHRGGPHGVGEGTEQRQGSILLTLVFLT